MSSGIGLPSARAAVAVTINAERTAKVDFSGDIRDASLFISRFANDDRSRQRFVLISP
jgi:hypothetical protein